jgi:hypothetical protein
MFCPTAIKFCALIRIQLELGFTLPIRQALPQRDRQSDALFSGQGQQLGNSGRRHT